MKFRERRKAPFYSIVDTQARNISERDFQPVLLNKNEEQIPPNLLILKAPETGQGNAQSHDVTYGNSLSCSYFFRTFQVFRALLTVMYYARENIINILEINFKTNWSKYC